MKLFSILLLVTLLSHTFAKDERIFWSEGEKFLDDVLFENELVQENIPYIVEVIHAEFATRSNFALCTLEVGCIDLNQGDQKQVLKISNDEVQINTKNVGKIEDPIYSDVISDELLIVVYPLNLKNGLKVKSSTSLINFGNFYYWPEYRAKMVDKLIHIKGKEFQLKITAGMSVIGFNNYWYNKQRRYYTPLYR